MLFLKNDKVPCQALCKQNELDFSLYPCLLYQMPLCRAQVSTGGEESRIPFKWFCCRRATKWVGGWGGGSEDKERIFKVAYLRDDGKNPSEIEK